MFVSVRDIYNFNIGLLSREYNSCFSGLESSQRGRSRTAVTDGQTVFVGSCRISPKCCKQAVGSDTGPQFVRSLTIPQREKGDDDGVVFIFEFVTTIVVCV